MAWEASARSPRAPTPAPPHPVFGVVCCPTPTTTPTVSTHQEAREQLQEDHPREGEHHRHHDAANDNDVPRGGQVAKVAAFSERERWGVGKKVEAQE